MSKKCLIPKIINKVGKKMLPKVIHYDILNMPTFYGDVAQLARASGSYPAGREFESPRRYQLVC